MQLFRIHIRPQKGITKKNDVFNYCLSHNILGVGWRLKDFGNTLDWNTYHQEAKKTYKDLSRCKYIKNEVKKNDLVWTRDPIGKYYLAKVVSGWEYFTTTESWDKNIDIGNVFRVELREVKIDAVPGKVVACFRATRAIQKIDDGKTLEYSKFLWNNLTKSQTYLIDYDKFKNIFMMLDDRETEDIIFIYLQSLGWYVVPNSRQHDTIHFEYLLVNKVTKEKALVQVKTGNTQINQQNYVKFKEKIFLFQSNNLYLGQDTENVISINPKDILQFIQSSIDWLPQNFQTKFNLISNFN